MNLSTWSRADLIGELLAPTPDAVEFDDTAVCEARPAYTTADPRAALVTHKIGVARELLMRDLQAQIKDGPIMGSPQALREWLRLYCAGLEYEVFLVLYLNARHVLIDTVPMFRGTLTQTAVYPREVVKTALAFNASAVVLAHNHPSGGADPSRADEYLTQTLKSALRLVDVNVLDHFVGAGDQLLSFAERGLL